MGRALRTNRDIERHYFEQYRAACGLRGMPVYGDKPDVILKTDRAIGIEITNFYLKPGHDESSEQRQRPRRREVLTAAQSLHLASGGRRTELTVAFDPKKPILSARKSPLAKELSDLARRIEMSDMGPVAPYLFGASREIYSVWFNPKEYADARWRDAQVYSVDFLSRVRLEAIVAEKETKAAEYMPCDAYWLLIVVDWIDPAQEQEITIDGLNFSSAIFERIILYKPGFDDIFEAKRL